MVDGIVLVNDSRSHVFALNTCSTDETTYVSKKPCLR